MRVSTNAVADLLERWLCGAARAKPSDRPSVLVGLIGRGIQSSRTPAMHEREGARLGLAYSYALVDFDALGLRDESLGEVIETVEGLGFAGLNVTHPLKQAVIPHLTRLDPDAATIGAVNTVVLKNGARTGYNTDSRGFAESFREHMTGCPLGMVAQFGAGGGGAAVGQALLALGAADLAIVDSDPGKAGLLAERLSKRFPGRARAAASPREALSEADGIVNATPIGMAKYPGIPFPAELLSARQWVAEIIYFPEETELLRRARAIGCRTLSGAGMAVNQAVRAFELFTGIPADRGAMAGHFEAAT